MVRRAVEVSTLPTVVSCSLRSLPSSAQRLLPLRHPHERAKIAQELKLNASPNQGALVNAQGILQSFVS